MKENKRSAQIKQKDYSGKRDNNDLIYQIILHSKNKQTYPKLLIESRVTLLTKSLC